MSKALTLRAAEFEAGLSKRELVREITKHTQAIDLAQKERDQLASLSERVANLEAFAEQHALLKMAMEDFGKLLMHLSHEQERGAIRVDDVSKRVDDLRKRVAESLDDTIATLAAQLERR